MVVEGLCRLLIKKPDIPIYIIDYDRVEKHNLLRQNFYPQDVGKYKSRVLAERYARIYGRKIAYSILPYTHMMVDEYWGQNMQTMLSTNALIIGCVDDYIGRTAIANDAARGLTWWLDTGNGYNSGQVLIGNTVQPDLLKETFNVRKQTLVRAPAPSLQAPFLLKPVAKAAKHEDCAEAIEDNRQSQIINQAMAMLVLEFVRRTLVGELRWLGAYLDLDMGILRPVPAEPYIVASMTSIEEKNLYDPVSAFLDKKLIRR